MAEKLRHYRDFWPYYLREHARPATRSIHFIGTACGLALLAAAGLTGNAWLILPAVVSGYAFAWLAHLLVEKNRPATFTYPVWSLISDFRMFFLWLAGRLGPELRKAGVTQAD
ncbi:Mpo1-like protein [Hwanghaeella sp.]|uniref:Mpo1-like protein n=1 Tax=Hwanghaeella sp. TaxID=2605943 RepID=UPI003CCBBDBF